MNFILSFHFGVLLLCQINAIRSNNNDDRIDDFIELIDVSSTAFGADGYHSGSYISIPGIAIFDCNNDGFEDIFYVSQENENHKLFINNGDFTFSEQAVQNGINSTLGGHGVVSFDFDNNGNIDLLLSYVGPYNSKKLQFYYNLGECIFEDRTSSIIPSTVIPELFEGGSISVSDFDHDGDLDFFVTSFGSFTRELPHYIGGISTIYKNTLNDMNDGSFTFIPLSRTSPPVPAYLQWSCVSAANDFDEDGWDDIIIGVCNDPFVIGDATHLWRNNFAENDVDDWQDVSDEYEYGVGNCNELGNGPQFPMSISYGHLSDDNDHHFDLFTSNAGTPALPTMYKSKWNKRDDEFLGYEVVDLQGLNNDHFTWGANFIDLDNDGKDDLVVVGTFLAVGLPENPGFVYKNKVNKRNYLFQETQELGLQNYSHSVVANADFDHDGYRDIVVNTVCNALFGDCEEAVPLKIYQNNGGELNRDNRQYLEIGLKGNGIGTNLYGVGSLIRVKISCYRYEKTGKIRIGTDGGVSNSVFAHFGIINKNRRQFMTQNSGNQNNVFAEICVEWMGKEMTKECWQNIQLDQRIILEQNTGIAMY